MRIFFLGNNYLGWKTLECLRAAGESIVALALHPPHSRKFGEEILNAAGLAESAVFAGDRLRESEILERIAACKPDLGVSVMFGHILRREFLQLFPRGVINLHPGLLPYNRGAYPNVWSIVDGTPAGVTLHCVDEGVDTGPILAQRPVAVEAIDTGESLYRKLEAAALDLFRDTWPAIRDGQIRPTPQAESGTSHRTADVATIDRIDLDREYAAGDLIDVLRARTFPPYRGAYFEMDGRRVYVRVSLEYDQPTDPSDPREA